MRFLTSIVLIVVLALIVFSKPTIEKPQKIQWEYKFEYKASEKIANELGADGWELVAIQSPSSAGIANNVPTYVFKRIKK